MGMKAGDRVYGAEGKGKDRDYLPRVRVSPAVAL